MQTTWLLLMIKGLMIGSIYALISLGFNVIYRTTGVLNFAQGEFVMLGGVIASWAYHVLQWPLVLALSVGVLCAGFVGLLLDLLAIRPVRDAPPVIHIIITVGAAIVIKAITSLVWGTEPFHLPNCKNGSFKWLDVPISYQGILIFLVAGICMVGLFVYFRHTRTGRAMKACSENRDAARLCGVSPEKMSMMSFTLSALLGGIAGILITPMLSMSFDGGTMLGLKGFSAAIIGGLGHPVGGVIGGLILGLLEQYGCWFSSVYKETLALTMVVIILLVRPKGLFTK